jgi:hypothetical protein
MACLLSISALKNQTWQGAFPLSWHITSGSKAV